MNKARTKLYWIKKIISIDLEADYTGFTNVLDTIIETKYAGEQDIPGKMVIEWTVDKGA